MAMVNNAMMNLGVGTMGTILPNNVKDSRWLTLEVCREFQRNKCTRPDTECKFAHPPPHVEVQNGRVTACFDSIKGKCQRKDPPCKYLHPPQHLREQLLQNGRNNLILKNLQMQAAMQPVLYGPGIPPQYVGQPMAQPTSAMPFNPYSVGVCAIPPSATGAEGAVVSHQQLQSIIPTPVTTLASQQKLQRADRLEVCREFQRGTCTRQPNECRYAHPPENVTVDTTDNLVTVCMDNVKGKCTRDLCKYFHPPPHLQAQIKAAQQRANTAAVQTQALPQVVEVIQGKKRPRDPTDDLVLQNSLQGVIPYKRVAVADGKSPMPMYQAPVNLAAYQQAIAAMQGQQYIPMTYSKASPTIQNGTQIYQPTLSTMQLQQAPVTITGHPPSMPRF